MSYFYLFRQTSQPKDTVDCSVKMQQSLLCVRPKRENILIAFFLNSLYMM